MHLMIILRLKRVSPFNIIYPSKRAHHLIDSIHFTSPTWVVKGNACRETAAVMLTIRKAQIQALGRVVMQEFEKDMLQHLEQFFPDESSAMGDKALRELIRHAIARAKDYGLTSERDLCKYLNLTMVYGRDFDTDPELEWMRGFLTDPDVLDPSERMSRLYAESLHRLEQEAVDLGTSD